MTQRLLTAVGAAIVSSALFLGILPGTARAQIIINDGNGLGEFSAYGILVSATFVAGLNEPQGIAISGTNLFVANYGNGTIAEYTTTGAAVNTNLISGLNNGIEGIAVSGTNLFVADYNIGTIAEYTTSGTTNNARFLTGLVDADGIAISGTNLYVSYFGYIGEYTTSGATNNAHLISVPGKTAGLAISGTNLFVAEYSMDRISEYTLDGAIVNTNLFAIPEPYGIAVSGNLVFVVTDGNVGEYTTAGATNNLSLFLLPNSLYSPFGIGVLPDAGLSAPATLSASLTASKAVISWPENAFAYQLQTSPLLAPASWTLVTNTPALTDGNYGISLDTTNPAQYYRLQSIN